MEEDKEGKKTRTILIGIFVPTLVIFFIATIVFALFSGIVEIIKFFVNSIMNFLVEAWGWIMETHRQFANWFTDLINFGNYIPPKAEMCTIKLTNEDIEEIKEAIENMSIDLEKMGLSDLLLKKIILTNYMTVCTKDTEIAIPITKEEYDILETEDKKIFKHWFEVVDDNKTEWYISTYGILMLYNNEQKNSNGENAQLMCYSQNTLDSIYQDYKKELDENDIATAESVYKVLQNSYTITSPGAITMYIGQVNVQENKIDYSSNATQYSKSDKTIEDRDIKLEEINYQPEISEYTMPMELLIDLLEVSASPDFIIKISELVYGSEIKMTLFFTSSMEKTIEKVSSDVNFNIQYRSDEELTQVPTEALEESLTENSAGSSINENGVLKQTNILHKYDNSYVFRLEYAKCWYCKVVNNDKAKWKVIFNFKNKNGDISSFSEDFYDLSEALNYEEDDAIYDLILVEDLIDEEYAINLPLDVTNEYSEKLEIAKIAQQINLRKVLKSINVHKSNVKNQKLNITRTAYIHEEPDEVEDYTDEFIALLRNTNGKNVEYNDIYTDPTSEVGRLLVNGSAVLYELMDGSTNTINLIDIMKNILYKYQNTASDYEINSLEDAIFDETQMNPVN